jgi:hypothetical protein
MHKVEKIGFSHLHYDIDVARLVRFVPFVACGNAEPFSC